VQSYIWRGDNRLLSLANRMVEHFIQVASEYEERMRRSDYVPRFSYRRRMLRDDGGPNRFFYVPILWTITIHFLKDIGLLRSKSHC
jgi:hypothetical protein